MSEVVQIDFVESSHEYFVNKVKQPSVTQILTAVGLINQRATERARLVGQAVHKATELLDKGILDRNSVHPIVQPYLSGYELFKQEWEFVPELIEQKLYHPQHRYCGALDRTGTLKMVVGKVLIDIKSSIAIPSWVNLQLCAYADCLDFPTSWFVVQLQSNGSYKLRRFDSDDPETHNSWRNILATYQNLTGGAQ